MSISNVKDDNKNPKLFKLEGASHFNKWKNLLQDHMFKKIRNTNMDQLTMADILNEGIFKKLKDNKWKSLPEDAKNERTYAEASTATDKDPLDDPEFLQRCTSHAFATGEGFHEWLYGLYADVRAALSDEIQEQTGGVHRGDLPTLLKSIN